MDNAAMYWDLFLKTGSPEAYLAYRGQEKGTGDGSLSLTGKRNVTTCT